MHTPTVSVIIPTYNRAALLVEAIHSALKQSVSPDEIIVVDDGSTDATPEAVAQFGSRVTYIRQQNAGPSAARNRGLRQARGDFIAFLDSDDLWPPRKIEWQLAFFERNDGVDFVFGDMANFSETIAAAAPEIKNRALHQYLVTHAENLEDIFAWLIVENVIPTPTVMCKRAAAERVGGFDETLSIAEDLDYWLRSTETCRWGFLNAVLLHRRRHDSNLIGDVTRRNLALLSVLTEAAKRPAAQSTRLQRLLAKKCSDIHYDLGSAFLRKRNCRAARFHLNQVGGGDMRHLIASVKSGCATLLESMAGSKSPG